jgi:hypothetical protein
VVRFTVVGERWGFVLCVWLAVSCCQELCCFECVGRSPSNIRDGIGRLALSMNHARKIEIDSSSRRRTGKINYGEHR